MMLGSGPMFEPSADGEAVYWLSSRPAEGGRNALIRWALSGAPRDVVDAPWNVRTRVYEYGGGAYAHGADSIWFVDFADGAVHRLRGGAGEPAVAVTDAGPWRHGELLWDPHRERLIALREQLSTNSTAGSEERASIVAIDPESRATSILVDGADFVSSPAVSPDGSELAWIAWDHPEMPWDATRLHRARFTPQGTLAEERTEATTLAQACMQPRFGPDGCLYYLGDSDGWWNLYRWRAGAGEGERLSTLEGEIGTPAWYRGSRHYAFVDPERVAAIYTESGYWRVVTLSLVDGRVLDRSARHAFLSSIVTSAGRIFVVGMDEYGSGGLYEYVDGGLELRVPVDAARSTDLRVEVSRAEPLEVPLPRSAMTTAGEMCHAWYYPPANASHVPLPDEKPPVILQFHGGPTAASSSAYAASRQFWTSRGFAMLDVNYRGSSGWGRAYRQRLYGGWGELDVEDAVATLRHAAERGLVDAQRAVIMGASAGGFTTLAALAFHDAFAAGVNLFGVSDLASFATTTHKFERHYLRRLVGDWERDPELLKRRSPMLGLDGVRVPLLTLQGSDDRIVPPAQSRSVVEAIRSRGIACTYLEFEGEGHGFRRHETLVRTYEAGLSFLTQVFGIPIAEPSPPVAPAERC